MSLAAGTRLGSYEIVAPLGAGGMGEVFRARDTRVDRIVALKVLPEALFEDPERRSRFEREARVLASLNHPGIAVLYSFEEIPGASLSPPSTSTFHILVMELLDGETLRDALAGAKVSTKKALDWAKQIAHALAAAHEKGIVHRDLKPENLFVTKDGRVKILDFGLAKLREPEASGSGTNLPTATRGTEPGVVMGTLGYMSPEQVKGKPADARSDIFSFGVVLYEILSGRRAFHKETAAETISAILREDPPDLSTTNASVTPGLERIVAHCLEKNPEQRFHSVHDLAFDLESLSGTSGAAAPPTGAAWRPKRRAGVALALAGMAACLVAGFVARGFRAPPPPPSWKRLTFRRGSVWTARFAPDGQTVVYGGSFENDAMQVFLTRPESPESRPLGLKNASLFAVSPTGELAVMLDARTAARGYERFGTLARVPLAGGSPRPEMENVRYADWAPNGRDLLVERVVAGKHRIELPAGKVLYESRLRLDTPRVSPKGDAVAFFEEEVTLGRSVVRIVDLAGKVRTLATVEDWWNLAWMPDGSEILYSATEPGASHSVTSLFAVSLSGRTRLLLRFPGTLEVHDVAKDGRVLLGRLVFDTHVVGLTEGAKEARELSWLDGAYLWDVSADGKTVAFTETEEGGGPLRSIYIRGADGAAAIRIGEGDGQALSPDGAWVLARTVGAKGALMLYPTGVGSPRKLEPEGLGGVLSGRFFPDGKRLVIDELVPDKPSRTFTLPIEGGKPAPLGPPGFRLPAFGHPVSPDGRLVALLDTDENVFLCPTGGKPPAPLTGLARGEFPIQWTSDGGSVYTHHGGGLPGRIWKVDIATGRSKPCGRCWSGASRSSSPTRRGAMTSRS